METYDRTKDSSSATTDEPLDYETMTSRQLKELAKQRGFNQYNNMNNTNLRLVHKQYDEAIQKKEEKQTSSSLELSNSKEDAIEFPCKESALTHENGTTFPILIRKDGMVNATLLCKAIGKDFYDYQKTKQTQGLIQALQNEPNIIGSDVIIVKKGGDPKLQGTWCHRLIAIDCTRWLNPRFALQVIKWTDELLTKGFVQIEKPLLPILTRTDLDMEAEQLEQQCNPLLCSNQFVLYIAYIGEQGLVKIGSSDHRIHIRESKHTSCESLYPQFRFLKIFPISSGCIEARVHQLLDKYRQPYQKQKEIYKPSGNLASFIDMIGALLEEHDLPLQIHKYKVENLELRNRVLELEKENMDLKSIKS